MASDYEEKQIKDKFYSILSHKDVYFFDLMIHPIELIFEDAQSSVFSVLVPHLLQLNFFNQ